MALRGFPSGQTLCAFRLGELSRSARSLTSPVGHTVQPRGFHLPWPSPTQPPKEHCQGRGESSVPYHPGLIPRSPVRAHGFSAQNAFDWSDPIPQEKGWSVRSNSVMNPTSRLEHPCRPSELPACQSDGVPARARLNLATDPHGFDAVLVGDPGETRCLSPISATNELSTSTPETHKLSRARLSPS